METKRTVRRLLDRLPDGCTQGRIVLVCAIVTLVVACFPLTAAQRTWPPPHVDPAQAERLDDLYKRAHADFKSGKPVEAEAILVELDKLDPQIPMIVYDLACARALQEGKHEQAMDDLERAVSLGFTDFGHIARDPDLDALRAMPRFNQMLERKETYLRGAAEASLASLQKQYGLETFRYEIDTDLRLAFAVSMDDMDDALFQKLKSRFRVQEEALSDALFEHKPEAFVTVLRPTRKEFRHLRAYYRMGRKSAGFYIPGALLLVARGEYLELTHEFTHRLHFADQPALGQGVVAPWIVEGLAVLTEEASFEGGKFQPRHIRRIRKLPSMARKREMIPLQTLVTMQGADFERRSLLCYAQSGNVMQYLWETGQLKKFYDTYKQTYDEDPTGKLALEETTGKPLAEFESAWTEWRAVR